MADLLTLIAGAFFPRKALQAGQRNGRQGGRDRRSHLTPDFEQARNG